MSRPVSSTLKTASKPALRSPLRSSTMPLLAPSAVSEELENPSRAAAAPALEVSARQLGRMQISDLNHPASSVAARQRPRLDAAPFSAFRIALN
jgi:hypothetical protein